MKTWITYALVAICTATTASADYRPGRIRPSARAEMEIREATGIFAGVRQVRLTENRQDDKGVVSYRLDVDGKTLGFEVVRYQPSGCGTKVEAKHLAVEGNTAAGQLQLKDMRAALCEIVVRSTWEASIVLENNAKQEISRLVIEGNPETLVHTLSM